MDTPQLRDVDSSSLWNEETKYSRSNANNIGAQSSKPDGKIYILNDVNDPDTWTNSTVIKNNPLDELKSIDIPPGAFNIFKDNPESATTNTTQVTLVLKSGEKIDTTVAFEGAGDYVGLQSQYKFTLLKFKITAPADYKNLEFILGPQNINVTSLSPYYQNIQWSDSFPNVIKCFLKDVEIETLFGSKLIQDLQINDEIVTIKNNEKIVKKITSIISNNIVVKNKDQLPIRILKSAIADNIPYKDLLVTPEHCLFIKGQFIPARMLVNGRSIIQDTSFSNYDYYHIETEEHSVIIADGMLTESYLDTDIKINNHLSIKGKKTWEKDAAAPLNTSRNFVETIYQEIENRANLLNLPNNHLENKLTNDHNLYLTTLDGHKLSAIYTKDNCIAFRLPPNIDHVTLHSRTSRPSDVIGPFIDDRRHLGVLINNITLSDNDETFTINTYLNIKNLLGWSVQEKTPCRWTLGKAELPLNKRNKDTIGILRISIIAGGPYLIEEEEIIQQVI